jgi:hypothetical protein
VGEAVHATSYEVSEMGIDAILTGWDSGKVKLSDL